MEDRKAQCMTSCRAIQSALVVDRFFTDDKNCAILKRFEDIFDINPKSSHFDALLANLEFEINCVV